MSALGDGGQAFPTHDYPEGGLTLRDWFAGQAYAALLMSVTTAVVALGEDHSAAGNEAFAKAAYDMADAMLKAREPS